MLDMDKNFGGSLLLNLMTSRDIFLTRSEQGTN